MQHVVKTIYESTMIILVVLTILTLWTDNAYNSTINWIVWIVFFVDFLTRFITTKRKWEFIKQNPFLVIAIIPLDQFFQVARVVRLFYLFRIKTIAKYYITPYIENRSYQSITRIILVILSILLLESILIWQVEMAVVSYGEALYVVIGHLLFFGHQLIMIEHPFSIAFLTITSIGGIVVQGLALQWAFSKLERIFQHVKQKLPKNEHDQ
ncbi:transporter [Oceanobacillus halotolerans]|uniref:transporter n=1 Tax=Oceanobacillus halotolerans TaxID=2663380 RepID=UPI0013DB0B6D|nr:transporter [Oceanobacillus halotolerans]